MEEDIIMTHKHKRPFRKYLEDFKGWLYVLPIIILMAVFTFYPLIQSFIYAFEQGYSRLEAIGGGKGYSGIGWENFTKVLSYAKFKYCLANTLLFAFISVPISTLLALFISVFLKSINGLRSAYQTIFFLPYLTNSLAVGAVFATMFQIIGTESHTMTYGLINTIFGTQIDWLNISVITNKYEDVSNQWLVSLYQWRDAFVDPAIWPARWVVIIYEIWAGLPFKILILFGALENVSKQYYDAAKIDGASKHTTLWKVTVPLISPMLSYLIITGFIGGFKSYTAVVGIFGKDKVSQSYINTLVGYVYDQTNADKIGLAAAAALILFVIILIFTFINLKVSKKRVHY